MSDISDIESWIDSCDELEDEEIENSSEDDEDDSEDEYEIPDEDLILSRHNTFIHLTKYERTKVLGIRAKQIEMGANPTIKYSKSETPLEIAEREIKMKKLPFKIKRKLPTGEIETICLRNL